MDNIDYDEDDFFDDGTAQCIACDRWYCTCCGCDCFWDDYEDEDYDEEDDG